MKKVEWPFEKPTLNDWKEKVTKELKGKPIESLNFELEETTFTPFLPSATSNFLHFKPDNNWLTGIELAIQDPKKGNEKLLSYLEKGASFVVLRFDFKGTFDFDLFFKGVELEWISCQVDFTNESQELLFLEWQGLHEKAWNCRLYKDSYILAPSADALGSFLQTLQRDFDAEIPKVVVVYVEMTNTFFQNLAFIRALKWTFSQFNEAWGAEVELQVIATLNSAILTSDNDQNVIVASTQSVAAVLAGVQSLLLNPLLSDKADFYRRILFNIQHLMREESQLDQIEDAMAGSYFIENLTNVIAEKAWQKLQDS